MTNTNKRQIKHSGGIGRFRNHQFRSWVTVGVVNFCLVAFCVLAAGPNAFAKSERPNKASEAELQSPEQNLGDLELRALLRATSPQEMRKVSERSERIKTGRIECEIQLRGKRVPSKCFEVMQDEKEAGLIATVSIDDQEEWLSALCKKRAQSSDDLRELTKLAKSDVLPKACLEQVSARALDLKYASEAEDPAALFADRFRLSSVAKSEARPAAGQKARKLQSQIKMQYAGGESPPE